MRTLLNLAINQLFNPQEQNLAQFIDANSSQLEVKVNNYTDNNFKMADWGDVMIGEEKYHLTNLFNSKFILGYVILNQIPYLVTVGQYTPQAKNIYFIQAHKKTFSETNKYFAGGFEGIYHHTVEYPELKSILDVIFGKIQVPAPWESLLNFIERKALDIHENIELSFDYTHHSFSSSHELYASGYLNYKITLNESQNYSIFQPIDIVLTFNKDSQSWEFNSFVTFDTPYNMDDIFEEDEDEEKAQDLLAKYLDFEKIHNYKQTIVNAIYNAENMQTITKEYLELSGE